uniref:glycosyltransferase family 2 protein n=1 Tax=Flavobacterium sp. TaxID=239 RepID=UPI00404B5CE9
MISILIPVYNYKINDLVTELNKQALALQISFEIVCLDDASSDLEIIKENQKVSDFENCHYILAAENKGRTATRNALAKMAKFDHLLFLDADILPANDDFIAKYLENLNIDYEVVVGGYAYRFEDLTPEVSLRWYYGKEREFKSAAARNKNKYGHVFSGNFLIRKAVFMKLAIPNIAFYGMDNYFSYLLNKNKINVIHIENPIFHLGLESNQIFFEKSIQSVISRQELLLHSTDSEIISPLISSYKKIKKWHLVGLARLVFKITEPILKRLIFKKKPNLTAFDLYRLGYLCEKEKK